MELELREINVTLSKDQKQTIRDAFINCEKIRLRLSKDALRGCDTLIVPTRFFKEMDNEDGIDAVVDKQTEKEMREEFESFRDGMREELKNNRDEILEAEINREMLEIQEKFKKNGYTISEAKINREMLEIQEKFKKIKNFRDEILEAQINQENWDYFGLFFHPAIDESMENKGIEFNLDYSLLNDLAKDFVKDNIKKLFE